MLEKEEKEHTPVKWVWSRSQELRQFRLDSDFTHVHLSAVVIYGTACSYQSSLSICVSLSFPMVGFVYILYRIDRHEYFNVQ